MSTCHACCFALASHTSAVPSGDPIISIHGPAGPSAAGAVHTARISKERGGISGPSRRSVWAAQSQVHSPTSPARRTHAAARPNERTVGPWLRPHPNSLTHSLKFHSLKFHSLTCKCKDASSAAHVCSVLCAPPHLPPTQTPPAATTRPRRAPPVSAHCTQRAPVCTQCSQCVYQCAYQCARQARALAGAAIRK